MDNFLNKVIEWCLLAMMVLLAVACDDNPAGSTVMVEVNVEIATPGDITVAAKSREAVSFRNISNGQISVCAPGEDISLLPGLYDVSYEAAVTLDNDAVASLRALKSSVVVSTPQILRLDAYCIVDTDDLLISEIFFTGTLQPSGNTYLGDGYIKLYNNTAHTVYADGLVIFESKFLTTEKRDYTPDIMNEAVTVQALYQVPGTGTDHPVEPGAYFLICDVAMDHRQANPNSFDLSHADFEWYDESSKPGSMDIDSPLAPNLDKWYCYTQSVWLLHNRGFKAYGIARIPMERDAYLSEKLYSFDYEIVTMAGTFPMSGTAYSLPNAWVSDLVTCSVASDYAWQVCSPALDSGYTYCGTINNDKTRFFHSVRRKMVALNADGNPILQDTNNSGADFNAFVIPSEIELQHSAVDSDGTPATTITYDGIIPVSQ